MTPEQYTKITTDLAVIQHQLKKLDDHEARLRTLEYTSVHRNDFEVLLERVSMGDKERHSHAEAVKSMRKYTGVSLTTLIGLVIAAVFERVFMQ